jgi:poly(3-hydroxybutyrate) depolymerase
MHRPLYTLLALALILLAPAAFGQAAPTTSCTPAHGPLAECRIRFEEQDFPFLVFLPSAYDGQRSLPALLVLHGAGGNGRQSIAAWQSVAEQNGIVLIAPTLPSGPALEPKVHVLFRDLLAEVQRQWKVDSRRIYVFGHSACGIFAFDAVTLDSDLFAAAAVHAAAIDPDYDWILKKALRKAPVALYIGDGDQFFSLPSVRRTRDVLQAGGFTVHYVEIPHHDHNYAAVAGSVNRDAWKFLSGYSLEAGKR